VSVGQGFSSPITDTAFSLFNRRNTVDILYNPAYWWSIAGTWLAILIEIYILKPFKRKPNENSN